MTSLELLTRENKLLREERERMINSLEHLRTDLDLVRRENTLLRGEREMNNKDIEEERERWRAQERRLLLQASRLCSQR